MLCSGHCLACGAHLTPLSCHPAPALQQRHYIPTQVGELARLRGETCIGFISADGEVHLVPNSASATDFPKAARLVVLSDS